MEPTLFNFQQRQTQNTKIHQCRRKKGLFTEQKLHVSTAFSSATEVCVVDCGPHGSCISGVCHCEEGWTGPECEQRDCHPRCIDHGVCREGKCDCHQGWTGEHCTIGEPRWHIQHCTPTHTWQKGTDYRGNAFMDRFKRATLECECQYFQCSFNRLLERHRSWHTSVAAYPLQTSTFAWHKVLFDDIFSA